MPDTLQPDVILITVDTLRADRMAPWGRDVMPRMAELAAGSTVFDTCISTAPWTGAAFGSIHTGLWPRQHGFRSNAPRRGEPRATWPLKPDVRLLGEMLRDAGYCTIGVQGNAGFCGPGFGFERGFADYRSWDMPRGLKAILRRDLHCIRQVGGGHYARTFLHRVGKHLRSDSLPEITPLADARALGLSMSRALLAAPDDRPLMLWINFMDVHTPYSSALHVRKASDAPTEIQAKHLFPRAHLAKPFHEADRECTRWLYDGSAEFIDLQLSAALERISQVRKDRPRLTVFLADHGEEFWEHGHDPSDPTWFACGAGHGQTQYNEQLHVPFFVHGPQLGIPSRRVDSLVSLVDVTPTLIDVLNLNERTDHMEGRSLAPCFNGGMRDEAERIVFAEAVLFGPERQAAISATGKLIRKVDERQEEFYAWRDDPGETLDLSASEAHGDERRRLAMAMDAWNARLDSTQQHAPAEEDEALAARLRALGYL